MYESSPPAQAGRLIHLPEPRGPLTEWLFAALRGSPDSGVVAPAPAAPADPIGDDDLQLALYLCYELHYARIEAVDERWEWAPALLGFRAALEQSFESAVAELVTPATAAETASVGDALQRIVAADDGPPLSRFLETQASREQMFEQVVHRSAYQLKESDPHSWAIPRLSAVPKAALLEVQFDEYGGGESERMHSVLFERTMVGLGLDGTYGAYLDFLPGVTLATVNLMSGFGLHRRRRGALVGHLAGFEMTSSIPNRRYGNALRRLGYGRDVTHFYDEHVEADAVHENIAAWDLAGGLARAEPDVAADILFGTRALLALEARWAAHLLESWDGGETSLRMPLPLFAPA
ncbi:MAG TPA: iron-containing redox enzyme family protein [Solirubrobacterales bacterium]|nr:iron-containing redox enzyme family protein [Solirubrobacterales bacterium]